MFHLAKKTLLRPNPSVTLIAFLDRLGIATVSSTAAYLLMVIAFLDRLGIATVSSTAAYLLMPLPRHLLALGTSGGLVFTTFRVLTNSPLSVDTPLIQFSRQHTTTNNNSDHSDSQSQVEIGHKEQSIKMEKPVISSALKKAKAETLWGLFVADSIAMPVHWYYNPDDIKADFGKWLTGFEAPKNQHPSSILRLSAVDDSGRGSSSSKNSLIGNVILHDKLKYWNGSSNINHYHQGMKAGDNTLNAVMVLHELHGMNRFDHDLAKPERDVRGAVLEDYVKLMTTPGAHNDTYAESFHRSFFKDWMQNNQPKSADDILKFSEDRLLEMIKNHPDHQLAVIGSFVPAIPWVVRNAHKSEDECAKNVADFIKLTHPVPSLIPFIDVYSRLLHSVINGKDLKSEVLRVLSNSILGGPAKRDMILSILDKAESIPRGSESRLEFYQAKTLRLGSACYVEGAFSSLLFLALEFHDDFEGGVLANANCGGENCHRGAALGALLAAATANQGKEVPSKYKENLHSLQKDIAHAVTEMNKGF